MVGDVERMQQVANRLVERDGVPGAALAVAVDGELVFEHYAGDAFVSNLETGLDDVWFRLDRVASVTTAALTRRR
jgi:hypothetical protein